MNSADRHLGYHHGRQADLVREARRRDLAETLAASRADERRSFLRRAWEQRFGQPGTRAADVAKMFPDAPPPLEAS
jgi:hypothetical protein